MYKANKNQVPEMSRFVVFSVIFFIFIFVTGSAAFVLSMRQIIQLNKGSELTQLLEIERVKLETSVNNEVVIALKIASSPLVEQYFSNPQDPVLSKIAVNEFASSRRAFASELIFWVNDIDKLFYYNDIEPYLMDPDNPDNYWYNMTLYETEVYNFNINYNPDLNVTNLWINAPVFNSEGKPVGMLGTGIDITTYLEMINKNLADGTQIYLFNSAGEITGARDPLLVAEKRHIEEELNLNGIDIFNKATELVPYETQLVDTPLGRIAIGTVPLLEWYSVAVMSDSIDDYKTAMTALFIVVLFVIVAIFIIFNFFLSGLLKPLHKSMKEAEQANRAKSAFLANMSHELRTPLNVVIGLTDLVQEEDKLPGNISENLRKISNAGNTLLSIVNDILDFSKIESDKLSITPAEYHVSNLLNDVIAMMITRIGEKPVVFKLNITDDLPEKLFGDELRVKQILNNLLSNAFKYTEKGSIELTINASIAENADDADKKNVWLEIAVSDTGIGISEENQKRLFTDYYQVEDTTRRKIEGTGLGLSITRKLCEMMNGKISVESETGKGSIFHVSICQGFAGYVPIGKTAAENLRAFRYAEGKNMEKKKLVRADLSFAKVLLVDDMQNNLDVASGLLRKYKMQVDCVLSGQQAVQKISQEDPVYNAIFMDHMMPGMDGIEAAAAIRALGSEYARNVPIVALTANAIQGTEDMFYANGFQAFLSKPINIAQLDSVVLKWIKQ